MTEAEFLELIKDIHPDKYAELKDRIINLEENQRIKQIIESGKQQKD